MLFPVGTRAPDDDRPTVDLGPRDLIDGAGRLPRPETDDPASGEYTQAEEEASVVSSIAEPTRTVSLAPPGSDVLRRPGDSVHGLPTQALGPPLSASERRKGQGSGTAELSKLTAAATTTSPQHAMLLDEIERTRVFAKVAMALCLGGVVVALTTDGDPVARWVVLIGTLLAIIGATLLLIASRDPAKYDTNKLLSRCFPIGVGALSGVYYWGIASPVVAMLVYGVYFFSLGSNRRVVALMYAFIAIIYGGLGFAVLTGLLHDRGVISLAGLRWIDQLALVMMAEVLCAIAFYTARKSQRVTLEAMTKLQQAVRSVAQRDAMLAEARAELDRALVVGGPGRFTEQVIGGFKLGIVIGRGGMGEVYEAHREAGPGAGEAAVKLLHPGTLAEPAHVQRFLREAQTAASFDCPNVVRVLAVGTTAGEIPFLAMERLRGHDLAHQLRRHRKLDLPAATTLVDEVSTGLEAARVAGIVHRDLKPHNVFHAETAGVRTWKILDFGVSKFGGNGTLTKGHVIGTPAYMAPEQARGEDVDHRADVYSLGAILYRAITGHPAFTGKDVPTTLYEVVYRVPTQPSLLASLPGDLDRVLAIALAKDPKLRFASALELAAWFRAATASELDAAQRRRADEVIAKYPWGTRPGSA